MKHCFHYLRLFTICLLILLLTFIGACSGNNAATGANERTIVDSLGRQVTIPEQVERIAAIDPMSGELLIMIGAGSKMVVCTNGLKRDELLQRIYPQLLTTTVAHSEGAVNAETLLEADVDVVLIKYGIFSNSGEAAKLDKLGIPYLVIKYTTMDEQLEAMRMIAEVVGGSAKEKADILYNYYQVAVKEARAISDTIPDEEKIRVYHSINEALRTDGIDSLGADWLTAAGLINVSLDDTLMADGENYYASLEQVFVWQPQAIICNDATTAAYMRSSAKWQGLSAVRDGQVYNIPVGATRWGHPGSSETYLALLWAGTTFYPEYYKGVDLKQEVFYVYNTVLELDIDDAEYAGILSGYGMREAK